MSLSQIETDLKAQVSRSVYVEKDDYGQPYVVTPFAFDDGDEPVIALVPNGNGWMLSDFGSTLLRLSYRLNTDEYDSPDTQRKIDDAVALAQITKQGGKLTRALPEGRYADALFEFAHALMRIDELGRIAMQQPQPELMPAARKLTGPKLKDEVTTLVTSVLPQERFQTDWHDMAWDHAGEYGVDCRVNGMPTPLLLHAVETPTNARDTTITIYRFQQEQVPGEHVAIFPTEGKVGKSAKFKLGEVCNTTYSLDTQRSDIVNFLKAQTSP